MVTRATPSGRIGPGPTGSSAPSTPTLLSHHVPPGDPTGTGQGGSKLPDLTAEFNDMPHLRGTVSKARTDEPNTANSQFFIVFYPRFALDHKYTNFGRVIAGMDIADAIVRGEPPKNPTKIVQASLASEGKAPPPPPAAAAPKSFTADMLSNSQSN